MKSLHGNLRRLLDLSRDRRGSIFVIVAVATPVLLGVLGLGADAGVWYVNKRVAQTQADAAALSGAFERARGRPSNVTTAARKEAVRNGFHDVAPNTITVNNPPATGASAGKSNAVEVVLTAQQPLLFAKLFLDSVSIKTRAVALVQTTGTACVLALDTTVSGAVTDSGSSTVNMPGCVMASNSTSSTAINITGSSTVTADSLWTAGNYATGGSTSLTLAKPPVVNAWAIDDPYAGKLTPVVGSCEAVNDFKQVTQAINPGTYCGGLTVGPSSVITFNPGTYYINAGDFTVSSSATIRCNCPDTSGVTIVLTTNGLPSTIGTVTINGNADIQLKAPSDGISTYSGLAFYQDPRAPLGSPDAIFNGTAAMSITGAIYFPNRQVQWSGNTGPSSSNCTQIIAKTVVFIGNSKLDNTGCVAAGVEPITITGVRVTE